jgi:hypothetical protein
MKLKYRTPVALGLTLALAACGGGAPPPPGSITVTVEDPQNVGYSGVYQVGSGAWQALNFSGGSATFALGSEGKYGVAVRCGTGSNTRVHLIQATNSELASPRITCSSPGAPSTVSFTVNVDLSAVQSPWGIQATDVVFVNLGNRPVGSDTTVPVSASLSAGAQDLLVSLVDPNTPTFRGAKVLRNVNVTGGGSTTVTLQPGDQLPSASLTPPTLPAGYVYNNTFGPGLQALVFYVSNARAFGFVGVNNTYRPVAGFASGDRYLALSSATNASNTGSLIVWKGFTSGGPNLSFPAPWAANNLTVTAAAHPTVSGLNRTDAELRAYSIELTGASLFFQATLSKNWLGSQTSYTLPDLSSRLTYTPLSGSVRATVGALISSQGIFSTELSDLASFTSNTDIRVAVAEKSYTVGGSDITLP